MLQKLRPLTFSLIALSLALSLTFDGSILAAPAAPAKPQPTKVAAPVKNSVLFKQAVLNMRALKSYQLDFQGGAEVYVVTETATIDVTGRRSRWLFKSESVIEEPARVEINLVVLTPQYSYVSSDGGKTYKRDTREAYAATRSEINTWDTISTADIDRAAAKLDSQPLRTGRIDGVAVRYITFQNIQIGGVMGLTKQDTGRALTDYEFAITLDSKPIVKTLTETAIEYAGTYTWSKLNQPVKIIVPVVK